MIFRSVSKDNTIARAKHLVQNLLQKNTAKATIIGLHGELGAGKTCFVSGIAAALGIKKTITSPTFLIMRRYPVTGHPWIRNLYHIDAYRIKHTAEMLALGWRDIIKDKHNLICIEWPENLHEILPKKFTQLNFVHGDHETERLIVAIKK